MKTAICAIIKDEHLFLKEWIDWHLCLGFDAIHLFEDKGSKSHEEICVKYNNVYLRRYEDDEEIQEILSDQGSSHRQLLLYTWFGDTYREQYDWVAFIDIDEFIVFKNEYNLQKLCKEFESYSAVLMNWRMIGASGHIKRPTVPVMEAYTIVEDFLSQDMGYLYKSLCNLNKWQGMEHLHLAKGSVNTNHKPDIHEICYDKVILNHYFTKSWEDWCDRIFKKGGTSNGHRTLDLFFECNKSMKYLQKELISSVQDRTPKGTWWINKKENIIAGGNVNKIMSLNGTPIINIVGSKPSSLQESLNLAKTKATHLGFNQTHTKNEKLIHFMWFGKNPLTKLAVKCIESWKKFAPDYTYCLWTEDSFDVNSHEFTKNAYKDNAWAFVSDYVRLWAIYNFGGIYFDLDVELLKGIDDLPNNWFALEKGTNSIALGLGFGADKGSRITKVHLDEYDTFTWSKKVSSFISPRLFSETLARLGYEESPKDVLVWNGFTIYPAEYMCPRSFTDNKIEITENTIAIHHYAYSWKNNVS